MLPNGKSFSEYVMRGLLVITAASAILASSVFTASPAQAKFSKPGHFAIVPAPKPLPLPVGNSRLDFVYHQIVIPKPVPGEPRYFTVKPGQSLSEIAVAAYGKNHACWPEIFFANRHAIGSDPNLLRVGQRLRIPGLKLRCPSYTPPAMLVQSSPGTQPAPVVPVSAPGVFSFGQLEALWVQAHGPPWAAWSAAMVAECESGGNPQAYNPSGASGLWQILGSVVPGNLFDPFVNALNAVAKFTASGNTWAQWVCQP